MYKFLSHFFIRRLPNKTNFFIIENIDNTIFWGLLADPGKGDFKQSRCGGCCVFFLVCSIPNYASTPLKSLHAILRSSLIKNSG